MRALKVIENLTDKTPFEATLIKHANNHSVFDIAGEALQAMSNANDLTPFLPTLHVACQPSTHNYIATTALLPLGIAAIRHKMLSPVAANIVIDATNHPSTDVATAAMSAISNIIDKKPFEMTLIKHAANHTLQNSAAAALRAISGANGLTPYLTVMHAACQPSAPKYIAHAALETLHLEAIKKKLLSPTENSILIDATTHPDKDIVDYFLIIISDITDKKPFISALQSISLKWPSLKIKADDFLRQIQPPSTPTPINTPIPVPPVATQAPAKPTIIKGVLLDFNIAQNGEGIGPDAHLHDAVKKLSALFQEATTVEAKVFYAPNGGLKDNDVIQVTISAADKEKILTSTLNGIAPTCNLSKQTNGTYTVSMP